MTKERVNGFDGRNRTQNFDLFGAFSGTRTVAQGRQHTFSSRMSSAAKDTGRSIVKMLRTCKRSEQLSTRLHVSTDVQLTVLHNVTDDPILVEVTASTLRAKWLLETDLYITDGVSIPGSAQGDVRKTKDKNVFDHFFAKVMVNAERLVFRPAASQGHYKFATRVKILAKGLLHDNPVDPVRHIAAVFQIAGNGDEYAGRKCEIEETVALFGLITGLDLQDVLVQGIKRGPLIIRAGNVGR